MPICLVVNVMMTDTMTDTVFITKLCKISATMLQSILITILNTTETRSDSTPHLPVFTQCKRS